MRAQDDTDPDADKSPDDVPPTPPDEPTPPPVKDPPAEPGRKPYIVRGSGVDAGMERGAPAAGNHADTRKDGP